MNLVIDIGNTFIKAGLFEKHVLVGLTSFNTSNSQTLDIFLKDKNPAHLIFSSVVKKLPPFIETLGKSMDCLEFNQHTPIPIQNKYQSASTLGSDRLAAAVGAWKHFKGKNILVVDSGTCIKYNFVSFQSEYLGGGISPGLTMRFRALHEFTGRLPLVEENFDYDKLTGSSTEESILSGVMNGVVEEVNGIINSYETQYSDLKIVLCGGNYHFFEKRLKNRIFALPNIVLEGLNEILEYNVRI